ncbi:hypothetical protein WJX72_005995 [[Myrmecia] bisecta]|uniref:LMBR1 domain-containing protein 2 n=1 Tax=[Myrmecia] bisecta TaxID=41462 RepID=A0AAW1P7L9_9CHLO
MWFFYAVSLPLLVGAILFMLRLMPSKGTSWLVKLDVGLAWFAALSTLVLVPTDVAHALQDQGPTLLSIWWRAAYWYGFAAQFTVLPFHQEMADSGHFALRDRLASSLKNNLMFYAVLTGLGAVGLLVLLLSGHLAPSNVLGFCIALSNAFGLIAGVFLMGYGLVAVPRTLWRTADVKGYQRLLCHKAGVQADRAIAAHRELSMAVALVGKVSSMFSRRDAMRRYMDRICAMADAAAEDCKPEAVEVPDNVDLDYFDRYDLGALRRRLRKGIEDYQREREIYVEIVGEYLQVEDIISNKISRPGGPFESTTHGPPPQWLATVEWWWKCHLRGWAFRLLAVCAALVSLAVVLAEATISPQLPNLSIFSRILHHTKGNQFATELLTFVFLSYPCICAYYAIYKLGRFSFYLLVPHHTAAFSLLANSMFMCRFAAPLAFNFMAAIAMPPSKHDQAHDVQDTVFYSEFGQLMMRQPVIGLDFTTYAPIAIVPYMLLLLTNFFNSFASCLTRSKRLEFEDDWETKSSAAASGVRLLRLEAENHSNGRPIGLTITPAGAGSRGLSTDNEFLPPAPAPKKPWWWQRSSKNKNLLAEEGGAQGPPRTAAGDARDRLAKAAERGRARTAGGQGASRRLYDDSDALSDDGTTPLMSRTLGGSGSTRSTPGGNGGLDSIFARMESQEDEPSGGPASGARVQRGNHRGALGLESDDEELRTPTGGLGGWFRRGRR